MSTRLILKRVLIIIIYLFNHGTISPNKTIYNKENGDLPICRKLKYNRLLNTTYYYTISTNYITNIALGLD